MGFCKCCCVLFLYIVVWIVCLMNTVLWKEKKISPWDNKVEPRLIRMTNVEESLATGIMWPSSSPDLVALHQLNGVTIKNTKSNHSHSASKQSQNVIAAKPWQPLFLPKASLCPKPQLTSVQENREKRVLFEFLSSVPVNALCCIVVFQGACFQLFQESVFYIQYLQMHLWPLHKLSMSLATDSPSRR